jgi:uncharacterized protein
VLAGLLALGLGALAALGQEFEIPANDGWVTDRAAFLQPAEERALEALMESYRTGSGQEIALLTVPDLSGRSIEEFALAVARAWKIGDRETSSGALLVVAREERSLRIEVGRGLEGTLTDSVAGRIIRDVITPEFREGRFYSGMRLGIEAIHAALGGDYGPLERRSQGPPPGVALIPLIVLVLLIAFVRRKVRSGWGGSGALPWILASQIGSMQGGSRGRSSSGWSGSSGGGFRGFGGGGGFSGGGASGRW